jgi:LysR family transcriptional regulator for bpeEF and oprC
VKLLREAEELEETMRDLSAAPSGMLHVDMPTIFSNRIVAPALPQFARDYPEISVRLTANDRFVDMVDEGIDVLVRVGNLGDSRLVAQMLATTQWISCAAPDYVLRNGRPTSLEELAGLSCLNFIYPKSGRFRPWTFLRDERLITIMPRGRIATDHIEGLVEAAVAGGGVIQALSISVQDEIANGLLVPLLEEFTAPGPDVNVLFQQRHLRAARVKVFVDFLHQTFAARKLG